MRSILIENTKILIDGKTENTRLLIEDDTIKDITKRKLDVADFLDLKNSTLCSGFVDIHNHGAVGVDVNSATADDLRKVSNFLATQGVTGWLPTFVPDSDENYQKVIDAIDEVMETQDLEDFEVGARILGVHYEGVFANEKMCGALRPEFFKTFKYRDEISRLPKLEKGVHFTTLAPEVENGIELIKKLVDDDWVVSIGHTNADLPTLESAFQAGAKHLTHFFNAMTGLHHRTLGVVGWALMNEDATFDIIADGVHVVPQMLKFACQTKTPEKVSLISDSVLPTGLGDGDYEIWGENISVANGKTKNARGSIAGSVITMLDAVKMMLSLGFSAPEVSRMASLNPAKTLGIEKTYGSIEAGKRADLVGLDEEGDIKFVMIGGKVVLNKLSRLA